MLALEARELKLRLDQVKQEKEKAVATLLEVRNCSTYWFQFYLLANVYYVCVRAPAFGGVNDYLG